MANTRNAQPKGNELREKRVVGKGYEMLAKVFLEQEMEEFVPFGHIPSLKCKFDGKILYAQWRSEERRFPAKAGDVFFARERRGGFPVVFRPTPPKDDRHTLMWLCGFDTVARTLQHGIFKSSLKSLRNGFNWEGYEERAIKKKHEYHFVVRTNPEDGYTCHLEAWISPKLKLTTEKVVEIMTAAKEANFLRYPDAFTQNILRERFGLGDEDIAKIGLCPMAA